MTSRTYSTAATRTNPPIPVRITDLRAPVRHSSRSTSVPGSHYDPTNLRTEYLTEYPPYPITEIPTKSQHNPPSLLSTIAGATFLSKTTTGEDYKNWGTTAQPARIYQPTKQSNDLISPNDQRDWQTESKQQYEPKEKSKRETFRPDDRQREVMPFKGESVTKSDYRPWESKPRESFHRRDKVDPTKEDRDFQTETQIKYPAHPLTARSSAPYSQSLSLSKPRAPIPFEGQSTSQLDYIKWGPGAKPADLVRRSYESEVLASGMKGDDRDFKSEMNLQYHHKQSARPSTSAGPKLLAAARAQQQLAVHPFNATTSQRVDYPANKDRYEPRPSSSKKPIHILTDTTGTRVGMKDDRDFGTETKGQYNPKEKSKRETFRPDDRQREVMPFKGESTTKSDYKQWESKPRESFNRREKADPTKEDRDFQTETAIKYPAHPLTARSSAPYSQASSLAKPRAPIPFEGQSTTQLDYIKWGPGAKPADLVRRSYESEVLASGMKGDDRDFKSEMNLQYHHKHNARPSTSAGPKLLAAARAQQQLAVHPFNATTSQRVDYPASKDRYEPRPSSSKKPIQILTDTTGTRVGMKDDRDFGTEQKNQFEPKEKSKRETFRPDDRQREVMPFKGESTTKSDYKQWESKPRESFNRREKADMAKEDRDFQTEQTQKFTRHELRGGAAEEAKVQGKWRESMAKPRSYIPFEGETTHQTDYRGFRFEQ